MRARCPIATRAALCLALLGCAASPAPVAPPPPAHTTPRARPAALAPSLPRTTDPHELALHLRTGDRATRALVAQRLRSLFSDAMRAHPRPDRSMDMTEGAVLDGDPYAPEVRALANAIVPELAAAFIAHPDESSMRADALFVLRLARDVRALPALRAAVSPPEGTLGAGAISSDAVDGITRIATATEIPEAERPPTERVLLEALARALPRDPHRGYGLAVRVVFALGSLRAATAVDPLIALVTLPLAQQFHALTQAAVFALDRIGDPRAADAFVYALYVRDGHQNVHRESTRALLHLGATHAVPPLLATLRGQNAQVNALIAQYGNAPDRVAPAGLAQTFAARALRWLAADEATVPLLAVLADTQAPAAARAECAETLGAIAVAHPSRRGMIVSALLRVFTEGPLGDAARRPVVLAAAQQLAQLGDPRAMPRLLAAARHPALRDLANAGLCSWLLFDAALLARRRDLAALSTELRAAHARLLPLRDAAIGAHGEERNAPFARIERAREVLDATRACGDTELDCHERLLPSDVPELVQRAALAIAWNTPAMRRDEALAAVLARIDHPNEATRRALTIALERIAPTPCAPCRERVARAIEQARASRSWEFALWDLEAWLARASVTP